MKKGLLTTLLLASGAALAVYLLKEEQERKLEVEDDEIRMIKLRSEEEDKELVRTIQEIENLPLKNIDDVKKETSVRNVKDIAANDESFSELEIPSFKEVAPVAASVLGAATIANSADDLLDEFKLPSMHERVQSEENVKESLEDLLEDFQMPEYNYEKQNKEQDIDDLLEDLVVPSFVEPVKTKTYDSSQLQKLMHPFGEPTIEAEEVIAPKIDEELFREPITFEDEDVSEVIDEEEEFGTFEIPKIVEPTSKSISDDDLSKTAIFDLPKFVNKVKDTDAVPSTLRNPFGDDELEDIDLSSLFEDVNPMDEIQIQSFDRDVVEETSELKLVDLDEEEIRKLFAMDDEDLEEIDLGIETPAAGLKKELSEDEFEEFKKRLIHVGEDDIDLINLKDSNPFETVDEPHHEELDIINFGNIVEEPTVALEDLILDKPIELTPIDEEEIDEIVFGEQDEELEEIIIPEPTHTNERQYPEAVYDISTLYPYLNLKFINAVFNNFAVFNEEFEIGSACRITHKVQFPEAQNLISFIEIIKEFGYDIEGTDEEHNILVHLDFENQESKILSEIYNISNQVNCLDGLYKGYELEHI